jgi:hypothetical protein
VAKHTHLLRKRRTREHIIADLSANHVERHVLLCGFSVEYIRRDYGVDLLLFTYDDSGHPEPGLVQVQLKATDKLRRIAKRKAIALRVDRRDLALWLDQVDPVILVEYDARRDVAYWLHVQDYFRRRPRFSLERAGETVTVRIPITNVVDRKAVRRFARIKERVRLRLRSRREEVDDPK